MSPARPSSLAASRAPIHNKQPSNMLSSATARRESKYKKTKAKRNPMPLSKGCVLSAEPSSHPRRPSVPRENSLSIFRSNMLRTANDLAPNLRPINTLVQLLIHQPTDNNIIAPHQVQAMRLLGGRLVVALLADDTLDGVGEDEVGDLVARHEGAGEGAAVDGEDEDPFWAEVLDWLSCRALGGTGLTVEVRVEGHCCCCRVREPRRAGRLGLLEVRLWVCRALGGKIELQKRLIYS